MGSISAMISTEGEVVNMEREVFLNKHSGKGESGRKMIMEDRLITKYTVERDKVYERLSRLVAYTKSKLETGKDYLSVIQI